MFQLSIISCDTPDLARVDCASLSDQDLLEIFVGQVQDTIYFKDKVSFFLDLNDWDGVSFYEDGNIRQIDWEDYFRSGSVDFKWLPRTLDFIDLSSNSLEGKIDATDLPEGLKELRISTNNFAGSLVLNDLPPKLLMLMAQSNNFSGAIDLSNLPPELISIYLDRNNFSAIENIIKIPATGLVISFYDNKIRQKSVTITEPNTTLYRLDFRGNSIKDVLDVNGKPVEHSAIKCGPLDDASFECLI